MFELKNFIEESTKAIEAGFILEEIPALLKVIESVSVRVRKEAIKNPNADTSNLEEVGKSLENFISVILTTSTIDLSGDESLDVVSVMKTVATLKAIFQW